MTKHQVNPNRKYHNFQGQLPTVDLESLPAEIPSVSSQTHPKFITDTTLRDGAQDPRFALFPNETKLRYYDLLHKLDNGTGRIEAIEVFIYQKRDLWTLEKLLERGYSYPRVTTWTRAVPKDIKSLVEVSGGKIKETGILASSSDHHIFDKLGLRSKEGAIDKYLVPILTACEQGIRPRVHLEDVTRADIEGWVIPFLLRVMEETKGMALFRLCDTLGIGVPDPYAALPFGVPKLVSTVAQSTGAELEFHGHNDFGFAVANSMAAFRFGCKRVNTAFGGLGERTGNTPLEEALANYVRTYGNPGFKLEVLQEIAELIGKEVTSIPEKRPIIGSAIFTTQSGLHQTGVEKQRDAAGGLIYLPFDPAVVGRLQVETNRIGALSGMDGIVALLNEAVKESSGEKGKYTVASKLVKQIYDAVHQAFDGSYDSSEGKYVNYRSTFFEKEEIVKMAEKVKFAKGEK